MKSDEIERWTADAHTLRKIPFAKLYHNYVSRLLSNIIMKSTYLPTQTFLFVKKNFYAGGTLQKTNYLNILQLDV
jgi:hypothetical protein